MNNVLYIGQFTEGTTSRMRGLAVSNSDKVSNMDVIDTNIPFNGISRLFRVIGFRFKKGPLINKINRYILSKLKKESYDLIWIDKGIFITKDTLIKLKSVSNKIIHFTPDMMFFENFSSHFVNSIPLFDYVVTTKSAELDHYTRYIDKSRLILTTQGYDKQLHKKVVFSEKEKNVCFIGLAEEDRIQTIEYLITNGIPVKLAGKGWNDFVNKHKESKFLDYRGEGFFSEDYSKFIGDSQMSLGLLSKRFPELHTTRTFEIPACGTVLLTEINEETTSYFSEREAVFFQSLEDLVDRIKFYLENEDDLKVIASNGFNRVSSQGRDYDTIIGNVLSSIL